MAGPSTDPTILKVAQREIPLVVSRNPRARRIILRLDGRSGDVRLVLPKRAALREGLDFARRKADWLIAQIDARPAPVPFIEGAVVPVLGTDHVIRHLPGARRGVWREDGHLGGYRWGLERKEALLMSEAAREPG